MNARNGNIRSGALLAEIIVALVIVALTIIPLYLTAMNAVHDSQHANNLRIARLLAQRKMGEFEAKGFFSEENAPADEQGDFAEIDERYDPDQWWWEVSYQYHDVNPKERQKASENGEDFDTTAYGEDEETDRQPNLIMEVHLVVHYPKAARGATGEVVMTNYLVNYVKEEDNRSGAAEAATTGAGTAPPAGTSFQGGASPPAGTAGQ